MRIFTVTNWKFTKQQNLLPLYRWPDEMEAWSSSPPVLGSPKWQLLLLGWSSESCIAQRKCEMWKRLESSQALHRKTGANHGSVGCTSTDSTCENFLLDTIWFNRATLVKNVNSYNKEAMVETNGCKLPRLLTVAGTTSPPLKVKKKYNTNIC